MDKGVQDMYQIDHNKSNTTGRLRVRIENGHNTYYNQLEKEKTEIQKEVDALSGSDKNHKREIASKERVLSSLDTKMLQLRDMYDIPPGKKFYAKRYTFNVESEGQAIYVENLFKEQKAFHAEGKEPPAELIDKLDSLEKAPSKTNYLDYLGSILIDLSGYEVEHDINGIHQVPEDIFKEQSRVSENYLEYYNITHEDIVEEAINQIESPEIVTLKNKKFIFISAFNSFTAIDAYAKLIYNLAKRHNVDGIITVGPWSKTIFLHKTSATNTVLDSVKKLIRDFKVYSLRSNQDVAENIPELQKLGVIFVDTIEDDNNLFLGFKLTNTSSKNQISRYRDLDKAKNVFVYSSYVTTETQLCQDKIYNIIGSGSSSVNLPRSRRTTVGYDGQLLNSMKYDSTGGHLLTFDSESNVHYSSFHYNRELKSILINGERIQLNYLSKPKKCDLSVVVSDMHVQHMNPNCFKSLLYFLDKHKPYIKRFILNGDFFDNVVLSHWKKDRVDEQIADSKNIGSFLNEIAYAKEALRIMISKLDPSTELIYKMGNHEVNSFKKLLGQSLIHSLGNMLDLGVLLDLKGFGFKVINSRKSYIVSGVTLFHGHEMNQVKGRKTFGRKNAQGHLHRCSLDNNGIVFPGMQDPTSADFMPYYKQSWANGWSVINESEGIGDKPEFVLLTEDGKFHDFDSVQDVNDIEDVPIVIGKEMTITFKLD